MSSGKMFWPLHVRSVSDSPFRAESVRIQTMNSVNLCSSLRPRRSDKKRWTCGSCSTSKSMCDLSLGTNVVCAAVVRSISDPIPNLLVRVLTTLNKLHCTGRSSLFRCEMATANEPKDGRCSRLGSGVHSNAIAHVGRH